MRIDPPTSPDAPAARPPVSSVVQAIAILRHLGALKDGAGVNAIARATGIGPSSCFNVLRTLASEGMVSFDSATKLYRLGFGVVDLARMALGQDALVNAARPVLARIAETHDAAVGLWRLSGDDRLILVALAESAAATRIHMQVGQRQPAAVGASGRAVLATGRLSDAAINAAYRKVRWRDDPGAPLFLRQVREAEARGWAVDMSNSNHGISTVAAVICDRDDAVRFAVSASIFSGRETETGLAAIGRELAARANELAMLIYGRRTRDASYA